MKVIIDRFEDVFAVCEKKSKKTMNILREYIPLNAKEGDVLRIHFGKITIDENETQNLKQEIEELVENLWE